MSENGHAEKGQSSGNGHVDAVVLSAFGKDATARVIGLSERRRGLVNGRDLFAGTRIPLDTIVGLLEDGWPRSELLANYARLWDADLDVAGARCLRSHTSAKSTWHTA